MREGINDLALVEVLSKLGEMEVTSCRLLEDINELRNILHGHNNRMSTLAAKTDVYEDVRNMRKDLNAGMSNMQNAINALVENHPNERMVGYTKNIDGTVKRRWFRWFRGSK